MKQPGSELKPSELDQAAAGRRSFGNPDLAANAEFKVIAEAMRELVIEMRLIRKQLDKFAAGSSPERLEVAPHSGKPPDAKRTAIE